MTKKQPEGQRAGEGTLLYPGKNPHRCKAPHWGTVEQGAVWQCDCGKRWFFPGGFSWYRARKILGFYDSVSYSETCDYYSKAEIEGRGPITQTSKSAPHA